MTKEVMKQALEALKNTTPLGFNMETDKKFYSAIKALEEALKQEQRKPLTDKQIDEIYFKSDLNIDDQYNQMYEFVKAIELAHGIKE